MVKRIFFGALILILLMQISFAENDTLIDSYSYDFVAEGTSVEIVEQVDTDEKTTITIDLSTTAGEIEISSILGLVEYSTVFFTEGSETVDLEFEKIVPGNKELLIMIYNEEELVAFITNYEVEVSNNVELDAIPESAIIVDDELYVTFDITTNLNTSDSFAKIISGAGTVYQSTRKSFEDGMITYVFSPKDNAEYSLYELVIEGYSQEFNSSLGEFDFSPIRNFKEMKVDDGLAISFNSDCVDCEKEIVLFSEEDEYVYGEKITSDSLVVPGDVLYAMGINGPYVVIITYEGNDYAFITEGYSYGDFEVADEEGETGQETGSESSSDDEDDSTQNMTEMGNETMTEMNETPQDDTMNETSQEMDENASMEDSNNESVIQEVVDEVEETGSNLLTGFSVSSMKEFVSDKKTVLYGVLAAIAIIAILGFVYIRQRKDAYLYEM